MNFFFYGKLLSCLYPIAFMVWMLFQAKWIIPDNRPSEDWPQAGNIVIKEFDLKYREGLPLVLMQIDCDIKPGERVRG